MLVLSDSDVSFLKKEIAAHDSPLYKRRTFEMPVERLPFNEALEFFYGFSDEEQSKYLALMATYPYYLDAIDHMSFADNVRRLLFDQYGTFFTLPDQLLSNSIKVQVGDSALEARKAELKSALESARGEL